MFPTHSIDGQAIYFGSNRSGLWQVWKMPAGGGEAHQITRKGGYAGQESSDGEYLYFVMFNQIGLWALCFPSGEEFFPEASRGLTDRTQWESRSDGLYMRVRETDRISLVRMINPTASPQRPVSLPLQSLGPGLSIDFKSNQLLLSTLQAREQDLVLAELP